MQLIPSSTDGVCCFNTLAPNIDKIAIVKTEQTVLETTVLETTAPLMDRLVKRLTL